MFWLVVSIASVTAYPTCNGGWPQTFYYQTVQISSVPVTAKEGERVFRAFEGHDKSIEEILLETEEAQRVLAQAYKKELDRLLKEELESEKQHHPLDLESEKERD